MATKLAQQAFNRGDVKNEASGLLNSIDAERLAQRKITADKSFAAAQDAVKNREYSHALDVLMLIDPHLLAADKKAMRESLIASCRTELDKAGATTTVASGMQPQPLPGGMGGTSDSPIAPGQPGTAHLSSDPKSPDSVATQADALRKVQFQKLRSDGLKIVGRCLGRLRPRRDRSRHPDARRLHQSRSLGQPRAANVALLLRPINSRLEMFRVMKGQTDALARVNKESRDARDIIAGRNVAEEQRKTEVANLVRQYHELAQAKDFIGAEKVAMQAKPSIRTTRPWPHWRRWRSIDRRVHDAEQLTKDKENLFREGLNDAERRGLSSTSIIR